METDMKTEAWMLRYLENQASIIWGKPKVPFKDSTFPPKQNIIKAGSLIRPTEPCA